ncbi:MAG: alanine racemase, partial [Elusimicrobia bacterium]|nr:alanine racemase [Elusimicrobiota bacterium]
MQDLGRTAAGLPASEIRDRIARLQGRIRAAAERVGRPAGAVQILAVTKTVPAETILEAARCGVSDVGESRVQEAAIKRPVLEVEPLLVHHFIGQLQTNKARRAVEMFDVIQSLDRDRLAESIDRAAADLGKRQRCLVEVKLSVEAEKGGLPPSEA